MATDRHVQITSPLGEAALFHQMTATEEFGRLFQIDLEVLCTDHDIALADVLGKNFSIHLETRDGNERYFHGVATRFSHVGSLGGFARYSVTLNPWLWLLTRTSDCRIFQGKSVPEIIKDVFRDHGFTDFEDSLSGTYPAREYCVQYRESDFNFVSRLMEHEGIYYFFEHEESKHTLVLADSFGAHSKAAGYATISYYPPDEHGRRKEEHFNDVTVSQQVQPGAYVVNSFDFEKPKADLQANSVSPRSHDHADFEVFDYPEDYQESSQGDSYARVRLEEFQARYEIISAAGDACGVGAGDLFALDGHPRQPLNQEYLIVSSTHEIVMHGYESGAPASSLRLDDAIRIEAIESREKFHTGERTPKPVIQGPQTAIVVGKKGDEIWTDEYGRIKVQFHWDREGTRDENSSCWIRVAQSWAGKSWGGIALPRIGQEVIVHFMSGDPDRPIVIGRVYNEDQKAPYELPANQTQSGIKSRSTKEGTSENFNEIRFEDKKDVEEIFIQAERDQNILIKNNHMETVRGTSDHSVQEGRRTTIGEADHYHVKADRNEKVDGNQSLTVDGDQQENVGGNHALEAGDEIHLKGGMTVIIEAGMQLSLKGAGGFIDIGPSGVTIQGTLVNINSGGSAGSGSGSSPTEPDDAEEVEEG